MVLVLLLTALLAGCAEISELGFGGPRNVPPEFRQKVGLYVHEQADRFYYPPTTAGNVSDLMAFHLQQTLPFSSQAALQEVFTEVEIKEPDPQVRFKSEDLAGYFEIKILSARYDYPDSRSTKFRADVQLYAEFKTFRDEVVWSGIFKGEGVGFTDVNIRLTKFGRGAATALEDAFQNAVYDMQDAILASHKLREYFRWRQAQQQP